MRRLSLAVSLAGAALALATGLAYAHAERYSYYPEYRLGEVPKYRTKGPSLVVCKADSRRRIVRRLRGALESKNLRLLRRCRFRHIQAAVNAARSGYRILVLPGVYREEPSRRVPIDDPRCQGEQYEAEAPGTKSYAFQRECPNAQNLIAITGDDDDPDRRCDDKCNLQIEGTGRRPGDVRVESAGFGDRPGAKLNVFRADRADGIVLRNFLVQHSDFNNVYVIETNGFRLERIVSRWSREYGFLSFTSDNGLYNRVTAYGSGDSGIYPGSGPEGHCERYGIEIRNSESHGNTIGWSGTAGNGIYTHDSSFHHNSAGVAMESYSDGHPGMPRTARSGSAIASTRTTRSSSMTAATRTARTPRSSGAIRGGCARRSRCRSGPASSSGAATGTSSAATGSTTTGGGGRCSSGSPVSSEEQTRRASPLPTAHMRPRTRTSTSATAWAFGRTAAAIPTASTTGGTRRAAATAGRTTTACVGGRSRATR